MCGGGGSQTVTQKTELDPVLKAHLYGGELPESALTGIMPAYFQPGGSMAGQAANVQRAYDAMLPGVPPVDATPENNVVERKDGGMIPSFQEGGNVFRTDGNTPLSLAEQVYQLTVGSDLGAQLPEYQIAPRSEFQTQAEDLFRSGIGVYEPYLQEGTETLRRGIGAVDTALGETQRLAGLIPGEIRPGQEALRQAALDTMAAAQRGETAAERAAAASYDITSQALPFQTEGLAAIRQGREMLGGAAQAYDPTAYRGFMDPYTEEVIRQSERDIARMGDIQRQQIAAQAVGAGAFGGSRQAVAEAELNRNLAEQQARTAAGLRSQGYQAAQQQAQQSFEQQQQRQMAAGQSFGQLGTATGALGTSFGQLGLAGAGQAGQMGLQGAQLGVTGAGQAGQMGAQASQLGLQGLQAGLGAQQQAAGMGQGLGSLGGQMVGIGGQAQQFALQDINTALTIGAQQQAQQQAQLDAQRMNQYQQVMAPYQQTAFRADILSGSPTGVSSTMVQPGTSPVSQLIGLGTAAYGIREAMR